VVSLTLDDIDWRAGRCRCIEGEKPSSAVIQRWRALRGSATRSTTVCNAACLYPGRAPRVGLATPARSTHRRGCFGSRGRALNRQGLPSVPTHLRRRCCAVGSLARRPGATSSASGHHTDLRQVGLCAHCGPWPSLPGGGDEVVQRSGRGVSALLEAWDSSCVMQAGPCLIRAFLAIASRPLTLRASSPSLGHVATQCSRPFGRRGYVRAHSPSLPQTPH